MNRNPNLEQNYMRSDADRAAAPGDNFGPRERPRGPHFTTLPLPDLETLRNSTSALEVGPEVYHAT